MHIQPPCVLHVPPIWNLTNLMYLNALPQSVLFRMVHAATQFNWPSALLYPGFLDPPKVGHQGVIKMIKVHFHSGNIRMIIFHKFGQFIPAKHLFKVLRVRCSICVRCSILILLLKTVRYSIVRCSIPHFTYTWFRIHRGVISSYSGSNWKMNQNLF
jgi:hypothetical protein